MNKSPAEETEQYRRMSKNSMVQPKPGKKTGFTKYGPANRAIIAATTAEFIAKGGRPEIIPSNYNPSLSMRAGFMEF